MQIAEACGVAVSTINVWKHKHPEFKEALLDARANFDTKVEDALAQRAMGYSCNETRVGFFEGEPVVVDIIKHYPPDPGACKLWLANRQPDKWRENTSQDQEILPIKVDINIEDARIKDEEGNNA